MGRNFLIIVSSCLMCSWFTGCALFGYRGPDSLFQSGEAYFAEGGQSPDDAEKAVKAYRKAISAYREVVDGWPDSEYAPEALYAVASCHGYISKALTDESAKQREMEKMRGVYRELAEKYPQSREAAEAFLSVGNDYFSQASAPDTSKGEKADLYRLSLESYRKALRVPGIEPRTRRTVEGYIRETGELLARDIYNAGTALVQVQATSEAKRTNAPEAIPYFRKVIEEFPDTDYADLSYVQLGLCYEYLDQWEDAINAYEGLIKKYTDANGDPISPLSENVRRAVKFARRRIDELFWIQRLIARRNA